MGRGSFGCGLQRLAVDQQEERRGQQFCAESGAVDTVYAEEVVKDEQQGDVQHRVAQQGQPAGPLAPAHGLQGVGDHGVDSIEQHRVAGDPQQGSAQRGGLRFGDEKEEDLAGDSWEESEHAEVFFEDVNFSYVKDHPVLKEFDLTVPSGKKVALVGATGSGKTTVVNLLMRFYDIDSGEIRINNQSIAQMGRKEK